MIVSRDTDRSVLPPCDANIRSKPASGGMNLIQNAGHKVPAAVIAGTVLETTLRKLCKRHPNLTPSDNINNMNDELAREAVYNSLQKKQVTAWAGIRNSAAHGRPEEFQPGDVDRMITGIRDFIAAAT